MTWSCEPRVPGSTRSVRVWWAGRPTRRLGTSSPTPATEIDSATPWVTGSGWRCTRARGCDETPPTSFRREPWSRWSRASMFPGWEACASRTWSWWRKPAPVRCRDPRESWWCCECFNQRPEDGDDALARGRSVDGPGLPAPQAREGPGGGADQAEKREERRGAGADVKGRREGGAGDPRPPRDAVPLPGGRLARVDGQRNVRAAPCSRGRRRERHEVPRGGSNRHRSYVRR